MLIDDNVCNRWQIRKKYEFRSKEKAIDSETCFKEINNWIANNKDTIQTFMKYTFLLSLFFELTQLTGLNFIYPRQYRLFDVDDLMINMLGGILGYFIMNKLKVLLPSREEINDSVKVSVLRKITSILINIFINNKIINYIILIIYFVIIPTINNKTLGMNFVNIKYDVANKRILRIFLRQVIICLYSIYLIY